MLFRSPGCRRNLPLQIWRQRRVSPFEACGCFLAWMFRTRPRPQEHFVNECWRRSREHFWVNDELWVFLKKLLTHKKREKSLFLRTKASEILNIDCRSQIRFPASLIRTKSPSWLQTQRIVFEPLRRERLRLLLPFYSNSINGASLSKRLRLRPDIGNNGVSPSSTPTPLPHPQEGGGR